MRAIALGLWLAGRVATGQVGDPTAAQNAKLAAAIQAVNALNDEEARPLLNDLLAMTPPDRIAAQAYLYLGIMDFNALDFGHAREELRHALELDPTIEIPRGSSPKIALSFAQIRRKLIEKLGGAAAAPVSAAPPGAVSAPPAAVRQEAPRSRSGAWPWIFGVTAVAAVGVGIWGWAEVASFESLKSSSSPANPVTPARAQSAQSAAATGEAVGIVASVAAAGLTTGLVLTW